ncbi:hypothetical protein, partial [Variovorax paradoxus]|uniref:hypothetical protein n=1 Tax=Variovorax paradoxus TaxID=34073 RepID=UPI001C112346
TDRAHVHVRLGAGEFTFCHFSILERAFPVYWFYVCTRLLVRLARERGGTGSQTTKATHCVALHS